MRKTFAILAFLLSSMGVDAQFPFEGPKQTPDTLYFPYKDQLQLIIIDRYDTYRRYGSWYDGMYPRGGSWFMGNGPAPKNIYLFRDQEGSIIKTFNADESVDASSLKGSTFINTNEHSLYGIQDYVELNNHLMFYGENDKVGLINLQGEVVVPAIYDHIRRFQDSKDKGDKLIIASGSKFGFLDSNLHVLFPPIYRTTKDTTYLDYPEHNMLNGTYIRVYQDDKCGLITEEGKVVIDFLYDAIQCIHDSMYIGLVFKGDGEFKGRATSYWHWGYQSKHCFVYDKNFNIITRLEDFGYIQYHGINRFIVQKDGKFGVLDHLERVVVPLEYDLISQENGVYHVAKGSNQGALNLEGKVVIPCEYTWVQFYGQAIYVTKDELFGVYNLEYKLIAKPQFKHRTWDMGKYILTRADGSKGFVQHQDKGSFYQSPEGEVIKL